MGRSLLKSQLERLSALEPKPSKAASVSKKANKNKKKSKSKSKAKISSPLPPPLPSEKPGDDNEAALGYFRATLTSKASEKARQAMSRALGL
jgi:hypothetical protein